MTLRSLLLVFMTLAFGLAPLVTPPFTGYDPQAFPVVIERPSIQPAGYAFAIWSVIYLWLFVHAGFGFWKRAHSLDWDATRLPLAASLGLGTLWLWIAGAAPVIATLAILLMLATALAAFLLSDEFYDRWLLSAPLAIYSGWLSAAAAVSTGVVAAGYGLLTDTQAAFAMLAFVLALASAVQLLRPEMPLYGLTVIWALIGVIVANAVANPLVALLAAGAAAVMVALLFWQWRRRTAH